jgi:hypothetical protein
VTAKTGDLLDAFTLDTDTGPIAAEIRLMHAEDGTEMLWHYENGRLAFAHPACRCGDCGEIITAASAGPRCIACATAAGIALDLD